MNSGQSLASKHLLKLGTLKCWPFGFSNAGVRSMGLQLLQSSLACGVCVHTVAVGVLAAVMKSAVNNLAGGQGTAMCRFGLGCTKDLLDLC